MLFFPGASHTFLCVLPVCVTSAQCGVWEGGRGTHKWTAGVALGMLMLTHSRQSTHSWMCCCHSVQISQKHNLDSPFSSKKKKQNLFFLFLCLVLEYAFGFLFELLHGFWYFTVLLYKKQTAPMSTPNSWSSPPMSRGAMSTIGRREVFDDLYSITVLPHFPVCFCWRKEKQCFVTTHCVKEHLCQSSARARQPACLLSKHMPGCH